MIDELIESGSKNKPKKKRGEGTSEKHILTTSELGSSCRGKENSFFEGMLTRLTEHASHHNTTKDQISTDLEEVKKTLQDTKIYYEDIMRKLKE